MSTLTIIFIISLLIYIILNILESYRTREPIFLLGSLTVTGFATLAISLILTILLLMVGIWSEKINAFNDSPSSVGPVFMFSNILANPIVALAFLERKGVFKLKPRNNQEIWIYYNEGGK